MTCISLTTIISVSGLVVGHRGLWCEVEQCIDSNSFQHLLQYCVCCVVHKMIAKKNRCKRFLYLYTSSILQVVSRPLAIINSQHCLAVGLGAGESGPPL